MGVGMPQGILLQQFGDYVRDAFGEVCYHVGSSLEKKDGWRDVDVRLIVDDAIWKALELGEDVSQPQRSRRWVAFTLAWSAFGRQLTGLPIDFQIQARSAVTAEDWEKPRSALFTVYENQKWIGNPLGKPVASNAEGGDDGHGSEHRVGNAGGAVRRPGVDETGAGLGDQAGPVIKGETQA